MKIQSPKRINAEDFTDDEQVMVEKIAFSVNTFMEEVFTALSQRINITDNLNQAQVTITNVKVDANGDLINSKSFKSNISGNVKGLHVIRTFGTDYVNSSPFIDFTENAGIIKINNIKGLVADTIYKLVILVIGD
jgi:hypothetical protein